MNISGKLLAGLPKINADRPILIAGPTASGKSALALEIANTLGGVIVNADASQVYDCWRVITARPSQQEEDRVPHHLYGHVAWDAGYSTGHWLREVSGLLNGGERPVIVGGTGLYFTALTQGMADIPAIPGTIRAKADAMSLEHLQQGLDSRSAKAIDMHNRARVQRAWEVLTATGQSIADWQAKTPPPILQQGDCLQLVFDVPKDWLENRINQRFDAMLEQGALDEVSAMLDRFNPDLPSCRAIGVPELVAYLKDRISLDEARQRAQIATRRFAKRQRTWFRSRMADWHKVSPEF